MNSNTVSIVPLHSSTAVDSRPFYPDERAWGDSLEEGRDDGWWATVARHRAGIFLLLFLCTAIALLAAFLSPPIYRAEAQIEFQAPIGGAASTASRDSTGDTDAKRFEQTQMGLVRSRAIAERVGDSLNVATTPRLVEALGGNREAMPLPKDAVVELLRKGVGVEVTDNSRLATVRFDSRDPLVSAVVANSYVENLIRTSVQRQHNASAASQDFLRTRLAEAKSRLQDSERALIDYTRRAGLIDPSAGTSSVSGHTSPQSLASEKLIQMNQVHSMSRAQRIEAEQRWREAQRTPVMSLPEVLSNPAIQQLSQRSAEAQAALEQERQRRTDQHPAVIQAAAQIAEINRQIEALASNVRNSIRERAEVARRQETELAGTVSRLEGESLADQRKGVRYNVLKREADTQRQVYESLLQSLNTVSVAAALPANTIASLDSAAVPTQPIAPRPALNGALGGAAGLALSLLYLFGIRILDDEVHSPDDLDASLRLPLLSVLPRVNAPLEALEDPGSPLSEAYFSLCAALELKYSRDDRRTLLFTSSGEGEGKTTTAYAVARNFAATGKRVLLVDADMRRPSVHRYFDIEPAVGLSTVLSRLCPAKAAVMETAVPDLFVLPGGPVPPSAAALLSGNRFGTVLRQLSRSFSMVIIDAPPVFGLADSPRLAAAANSVIFVLEAERAKLANVKAALRRLREARANVIGGVLTKMDVRRAGASSAGIYVYEYRSSEPREQVTSA